MLHRFLSLLMLLTLMGCNSDKHTTKTTGETQIHTQSQQISPAIKTLTQPQETVEIPNFVEYINTNLKLFIEWNAKIQYESLMTHYSVADRFLEAGGVKLCEAFMLAMSPEWGFSFCEMKRDPLVKAECLAARQPLLDFAKKMCEVTVEESLLREVDPGMIIADFENESNLGRVRFNRWTKTFYIGTDIRPKPPVPDHGETGLPQLLPPNYRRGTCVGRMSRDGKICLGEILDQRTQFERRAALIEHPEWQFRLGIREIARHREICTPDERVKADDFWTWISVYNQGRCLQDRRVLWRRWIIYATRVMRNYLRACNDGTIMLDDGTTRLIREVWNECARVEEAYPRLMRRR